MLRKRGCGFSIIEHSSISRWLNLLNISRTSHGSIQGDHPPCRSIPGAAEQEVAVPLEATVLHRKNMNLMKFGVLWPLEWQSSPPKQNYFSYHLTSLGRNDNITDSRLFRCANCFNPHTECRKGWSAWSGVRAWGAQQQARASGKVSWAS